MEDMPFAFLADSANIERMLTEWHISYNCTDDDDDNNNDSVTDLSFNNTRNNFRKT
jgi:hypothetical protein